MTPGSGDTPIRAARRRIVAKRRTKKRVSGERAVPHVRAFLGQRVRDLRAQRGFSQERLGDSASLSGKFIGEVERGEKSISPPITMTRPSPNTSPLGRPR